MILTDMNSEWQFTTRKGAGSQRWQRPVYVDSLPPCNHACPAGENIQAWLSHAQAGDYELAWQALVQDNPLPAAHGRACYHPCESSCNRGQLDEAVAIHSVERFLGDLALPPSSSGGSTSSRPPVRRCWWSAPALVDCLALITLPGLGTRLRSTTPTPILAE